MNGWGPPPGPSRSEATICSDWVDKTAAETRYNGWDGVVSRQVHDQASIQNTQSGEKHVPFTSNENAIFKPAPSAPPLPIQVFDGNISVKTDDGLSLCVICCEATIEGACIPCGHMAGCMSCLNEIVAKNGVCPICRTKIEQVIKLHPI